MFIPEYTITPGILKKIGSIEYNRAIIDNTILLANYEEKLVKEAKIAIVINTLAFEGKSINEDYVKKYVDELLVTKDQRVEGLLKSIKIVDDIVAESKSIDEATLTHLHMMLSGNNQYRSKKIENRLDPEEILAEVVELFDWSNSLDAVDTNPIVVAGIIKGYLELIAPYDEYNFILSNVISSGILINRGYKVAKYIYPESFYFNSKNVYSQHIDSIILDENDYTNWLEYYTDGIYIQMANILENVKLFEKDTKIAKVTGRAGLSERQTRIVEYIQDYGMLQNKQFGILFPGVSEDSVLRDIKKLIDEGIIEKKGSTKSSRYELK